MFTFITILIHLVLVHGDYHIINPSSNITCPSSINGTCFIKCHGNSTTSQCTGITINCGKASNCTINCDTNSCSKSTIINKNVNNMNLFISGNSFNDSSIFANMLHNDSIININCFHNSSQPPIQTNVNCHNINWKFLSYNQTNIGSVHINCNSAAACSNSNIFAETINYLWFNCSNPTCIPPNRLCVCSNMNISTPIFGNTNVIMSQQNEQNIPSLINIFNIKGYNNLNLTGSVFPYTTTTIYCGLLYENQCAVTFINNTWHCSNKNYLCLKGNNIYDSEKVSLQISFPNIETNTINESIYTNVNCENDKSCYIYPQSVLPLVMNVSNIYRFNCAINENCSIVYCNEMCSGMIIAANDTNNTFINCNHYSNTIISDCSGSNISATNTNVISFIFYEFGQFNIRSSISFANSTVNAMNVSLLQIDAINYDFQNVTVYGSLKYYNGRNNAYIRCDKCMYSNIYYLNKDRKMDYLNIECQTQISCNELTVYYDLNKYYGCNYAWISDRNEFICEPFSPGKEPYDDTWWTYTIFIPVAVVVMIGVVYVYRSFCQKKEKPKIGGYGAISDA